MGELGGGESGRGSGPDGSEGLGTLDRAFRRGLEPFPGIISIFLYFRDARPRDVIGLDVLVAQHKHIVRDDTERCRLSETTYF